MGTGYEYLVGKFADDAGHTAQEFYTNRTVVALMAEILKPQPGESIYESHLRVGRYVDRVPQLAQESEKGVARRQSLWAGVECADGGPLPV